MESRSRSRSGRGVSGASISVLGVLLGVARGRG